jgi:hypothetical protein
VGKGKHKHKAKARVEHWALKGVYLTLFIYSSQEMVNFNQKTVAVSLLMFLSVITPTLTFTTSMLSWLAIMVVEVESGERQIAVHRDFR